MSSEITRFGFIWNAATVERVCEIDGMVVISVKTDSQRYEIYVSPKGKRIRVFDMKRKSGQRELK